MKFSIIIPTHRRHKEILQLLISIGQQKTDGIHFDVIVVSNLSDVALEKNLKKQSWPFPLHILTVGAIGVNKARNLGLAKAHSPWVYFLDDDIILANPHHLTQLISIAKENAAVAIGGEYSLSQNVKTIDKVYHQISMSWLKRPGSVVSLVGGNTLYKRDAIREELLFNEDITFGGAETELNLRLQKANYTLFLSPDLAVEHRTQLTFMDLAYKGLRQGMGHSIHQTILPQFDLIASRALEFKTSDFNASKGQYLIGRCYYAVYRFFFNIGYRHGVKSQSTLFSYPVFIKCFISEVLPWPLSTSAYTPHPDAIPIHLKSKPTIALNEIFHWYRANILWKIPHFIRWKIIDFTIHFVRWKIIHVLIEKIHRYLNFLKWNILNPILWHALPVAATYFTYFLWYLSPFNTIGLRVPYDIFCNRLESLWKRPNLSVNLATQDQRNSK